MRYTVNLGCKYRGVPHDIKIVHENPHRKIEVCVICNKKFNFNKVYKSRIDNKEYLKIHIRSFAQPRGPTRAVYMRTYKPEKCVIKL